MANTFDMTNNALMRELERLDGIDPTTDDGKAEIARAKAVREVCNSAIANANATVHAMNMMGTVTGGMDRALMPALLGGGGNA